MPPLVMKEPQGGILNQTNKLIDQAPDPVRPLASGVPWGISEAAYNARDREMTYQYTNFGVPGLGLKRGLGQNTVIAPYATMLAAQFMPREAVRESRRGCARSARSAATAIYDAVDFTPQRVPEGTDHARSSTTTWPTIRACRSRRSPTSIFEGRLRDRFHSDPVIEAAELLLQEKAPRDIPVVDRPHRGRRARQGRDAETERRQRAWSLDPARALRSTNLMSNGRYSVMVTATGSGYSRWNDLSVTRWQPDPTEDRLGTYHLPARHRRPATGGRRPPSRSAPPARRRRRCSATTRRASSRRSARCAPRSSASSFPKAMAKAGASRSTMTASTDRHHRGDVLCRAGAGAGGRRQCASGLLEDVRGDRDRRRTTARSSPTRRKREPSEPDIALAHFVTDSGRTARDAEAETDRRAFIGRGRTIADAAAFDPGARLGGHRRLHARSDRGAAPPRARAGQQEGIADLLDGRRRRTATRSKRRSTGSTIPRASPARRCLPGRARRCRRAIWASASPMRPMSRSWRAT